MNTMGRSWFLPRSKKQIASHKLEKDYRGQDVILRQLLQLDQGPASWSDTNYDYSWIADYASGNPNPIKFRAVKQKFTRPFDVIPALDWDAPEPKHIDAGCKK